MASFSHLDFRRQLERLTAAYDRGNFAELLLLLEQTLGAVRIMRGLDTGTRLGYMASGNGEAKQKVTWNLRRPPARSKPNGAAKSGTTVLRESRHAAGHRQPPQAA